MLAFQLAQDVLQPVLDAAEIAAAIAGGFQAFEQIGHTLLEMGKGVGAVIADLQAVDTVRERPQRAFEVFGGAARDWPLAAFEQQCQRRDALFEEREGITVLSGAGQLVDLGRQQVHVLGEPHQRIIGGDVRGDAAKRRDRAFELVHRAGIVIGAQDRVELGAEIADCLVIAGEMLSRRQRAKYLTDVRQRAFDAGHRLAVDGAQAIVVDSPGQGADVVLDALDRPAWHRLGEGGANFGQLVAEARDRLVDRIGALQRLELARDVDEIAFERGEIRRLRRARHDRRRVARRHRARCGIVEFALARGNFRDRGIHRGRAERRGGTIHLVRGALDGVLGLALLVLAGFFTRRGRDLRQPCVEPRDRVVELSRHAVLASGLAARQRTRDLLDLAGNGIKPLMDVRNRAVWRHGTGSR